MGKYCIYCKADIDQNSVVDVCQRCGISVWGHKMFATIVENMQGAKEAGDLYQGSVTDAQSPDPQLAKKNNALSSIAQEALATQDENPVERQIDHVPEPSKNDIPSLAEPFSSPESLGPEKEVSPEPPQQTKEMSPDDSPLQSSPQSPQPNQPPQHPQPFEPQVRPDIHADSEEKRPASFFIDNLNKF